MIPINPAQIEIFLQPGEVYFGDHGTRIRTVLGSCVAITMWHPQLQVGGMCHFMLPARGTRRASRRDGRYGDEAMSLLVEQMRGAGTEPREYEAKVFGGGRMFSFGEGSDVLDIGSRNIETARHLLHGHGLACASEHLAGVGHRNIIFDVASGDVWVKHMPEPVGLRNVA